MQSLAELKKNPDRRRNFLIYGDPGAGKTCFATSFPRPIRVFDFDDKISSAADFLPDEILSQIHFTSYKADKVGQRSRPIQAFVKDWNEFVQKPGEYRTVIIDSLTALADEVMLEEMIQRPGQADRDKMFHVQVPNLKDYQVAINYAKEVIRNVLASPVQNTVLTGHLARDKDESTGIIVSQLSVWGKDLPSWIPKMFQEVYYFHTKQEADKTRRLIQTSGSRNVIARSQLKNVPAFLDVTNGFKELERYF